MGATVEKDMAMPGLSLVVRTVIKKEMGGRLPKHGIRVVVDKQEKRFRIEAVLCKDKNCAACLAVIEEGKWVQGGDQWRTVSGSGSP